MSIGAKIVFSSGCQNEVFEKEICIFCFCPFHVGERQIDENGKAQNEKRQSKTDKNSVFQVVIRKRKMKKKKKTCWQKLPNTICVWKGENTAFSCTLSVLAKISFGTKAVKTKKHHKIRVFGGNCLKPFLNKVFFGMGEKVGFTNCVLESCVLLKHYVRVFSAKHSNGSNKNIEKLKIYEK